MHQTGVGPRRTATGSIMLANCQRGSQSFGDAHGVLQNRVANGIPRIVNPLRAGSLDCQQYHYHDEYSDTVPQHMHLGGVYSQVPPTSMARGERHLSTSATGIQEQVTAPDDALDMIAGCLAYYKVMFRRLQDAVPLDIRHYLESPLAAGETLSAALRTRLLQQGAQAQLGGREDVAHGLLQQDRRLVDTRARLTQREHCLKDAVAMLQRITADIHLAPTGA